VARAAIIREVQVEWKLANSLSQQPVEPQILSACCGAVRAFSIQALTEIRVPHPFAFFLSQGWETTEAHLDRIDSGRKRAKAAPFQDWLYATSSSAA
jgi:hypothetical protein